MPQQNPRPEQNDKPYPALLAHVCRRFIWKMSERFSWTILSDFKTVYPDWVVNSLKMFVIVGFFHRRLTYMFSLSKQWILHKTVFHLHPHYMFKFYVQTGTQTVLIGLCCVKTCQCLSANCSRSGTLNSYPITTNIIRLHKTYLCLLARIKLIFHIKIRSFGALGLFRKSNAKIKISKFLGDVLEVLAVSSS